MAVVGGARLTTPRVTESFVRMGELRVLTSPIEESLDVKTAVYIFSQREHAVELTKTMGRNALVSEGT
jgi:hypothetical protein